MKVSVSHHSVTLHREPNGLLAELSLILSVVVKPFIVLKEKNKPIEEIRFH